MSSAKRRALVLAAWTVFVWTTRIGNILRDHTLSDGGKAGRVGLALSFTVLAAAVLWTALRDAPNRRGWVMALGGWTLVVWVERTIGIIADHHSAAFVAVHVVLAVVSVSLSWWAFRAPVVEDSGSPLAERNR